MADQPDDDPHSPEILPLEISDEQIKQIERNLQLTPAQRVEQHYRKRLQIEQLLGLVEREGGSNVPPTSPPE